MLPQAVDVAGSALATVAVNSGLKLKLPPERDA
jgi:hypothetical protein